MVSSLPILEAASAEDAELYPGRWWHFDERERRVVCDLCPRRCELKDGDRGFCFVRQNVGDRMMLTTFGKSTGFCIDPIEKKPLNHFYPGTSVLSFGTAGCNLGCKFCQNWDISKSREIERLSERAWPEDIARAASELGCRSVAFTYNDPVIWAEYAIETAKACRAAGVKTVAVTAGYITEEARAEFYEHMDAANVDLKAFTEEFYYRITLSHLQPVLDTLRWLKAETDVWFEITNLVIPQANDSPDEFRRMCEWILEAVGDQVPLHFSAFHPDFRMMDRPHTPPETLNLARDIALGCGLKHVYTGNVHDLARQSTYCPNCRNAVIERDWYDLGRYALAGNRCQHCGHEIAGRYEDRPGHWGRRRLPVDMRRFATPHPQPPSPRSQATPRSQALPGNARPGCSASRADAEPVATAGQVTPPGEPTRRGASETCVPRQSLGTREGQSLGTRQAPEGDRAMATQLDSAVELTPADGERLLRAAGELVRAAVLKRKAAGMPLDLGDVASRPCAGTFVSLKRRGHLRSCCGSFGRTGPLLECLEQAARRTAVDDPRFPPVSASELPHLDLELWLLHGPEQVIELGEARVSAVTVGRHGLQIISGEARGLLLPGVPVEQGWDAEEFLNQVCIKAGLAPTAWRDNSTTLFRFAGSVFRGRLAETIEPQPDDPGPLYTAREFATIAQHGRAALDALLRGAIPLYYCSAVSDANVNGVAVTVAEQGTGRTLTAARHSPRQTVPLQSTLHGLCESLAASMSAQGFRSGSFTVDVSLLTDTAMHGTAADPDLDGFDSERRGLIVAERSRSTLVFDRQTAPQALFEQAVQLARVNEPESAQLFSVAVQSTSNPLSIVSGPQAVRGPDVRPPAVAGAFYPADPDEVNRQLDELLAGEAPRDRWRACLVPHAGWTYSGRLAADVLRRVEFPRTIIALGPRHTSHGVEWAVAPHREWSLPTGRVASDPDLARSLAAAIDGLELDAAAHRQEHGIEVELPIIHRLSPGTRVVGIAIGGGNLDRCERFAAGLASVIEQLEEPPLLLISSDMNHFASDAENRRLDALALEPLERLDADSLYDTVRTRHISMCGMLPAVIVLKTLEKLGSLSIAERVGYATSADVTGDTSRVVGYAGMLFR